MIISQALTAVAALAAAAAVGAWLGYDYRDARAGRERASQALEVSRSLERSMERRAAADKVFADVQSAVNAALRRPRAPSEPIKCPPSGDVRDAVLPGLGDRLRAIDASANGRAPAGLAVVP